MVGDSPDVGSDCWQVQALDIKCGEEGTVKYAINALNAAAPTYAYKCCSQVDATGTCNPLWNVSLPPPRVLAAHVLSPTA